MIDLLSSLGLVVWDMDPVLLNIGDSIHLRYYGVFFALALAVGYYTLRWRYKDEHEDPESATNLTYALIAAVVIGARLVHCLFYEPERYLSDPVEILYFWRGGLASHGAAAGMMLVCIFYDRFWRRTPLRVTVDRLAFCIPFAMICVRLGNFFNSEIVGAPCDPNSPIAFIFTRYDSIPRYPSQLFEAGMGVIAGIVMFGMYFYYKKRGKPRPLGLSTSLILVLYFGMRFCVEYFKEYQVAENIGGLREGQILSIPFFIIGVIGVANCLWGSWKNQNVLQFTTAYQVSSASAEDAKTADSESSNSASETKAADSAQPADSSEAKAADSADSADSAQPADSSEAKAADSADSAQPADSSEANSADSAQPADSSEAKESSSDKS